MKEKNLLNMNVKKGDHEITGRTKSNWLTFKWRKVVVLNPKSVLETKNLKASWFLNQKLMLSVYYIACSSKINKLLKEKETSGLFGSLDLKTTWSKIPFCGNCFSKYKIKNIV